MHDYLHKFLNMLQHANTCPIWISYSLKIVEEIDSTVQLMWTNILIEMEKQHLNSVQKEKQETVIELYDTAKKQLQKVRERPFYNVLV